MPRLCCFLLALLSLAHLGPTSGDGQRWTYPGVGKDIEGSDVTVSYTDGTLRGKRRQGVLQAEGLHSEIDWFLGIPYAEAPIGERRFSSPVPAVPWTTERNATRFGFACPQIAGMYYSRQEDQSEDCLFLNVYTPVVSDTVLLPVLVYVHGGSYRVGASSGYPGQLLAQHGMVVVTVNYRLGLLGFICSGGTDLPGNYGLMDQILALQWVQNNIKAFRGDAGRVTLVGNSAGGASVSILSASPPAKGLFQQVIVSSGSLTSSWNKHQISDLELFTQEVASHLNCSNVEDSARRLSCLRSLSWQSFRRVYIQVSRVSITHDNFLPCVDGYILPGTVDEMVDPQNGLIHVKRVLMGTTDEEWGMLAGWLLPDISVYSQPLREMRRGDFLTAVNEVVGKKMYLPSTTVAAVINYYTDYARVNDSEHNAWQYRQAMSDVFMVAPTDSLAMKYQENGLPVYMYSFSHISRTVTFTRQCFHMHDLEYMFGTPFLNTSVLGYQKFYDDTDRAVSLRSMGIWNNFVAQGNPTPQGTNLPIWIPYDPTTKPYYQMGTDHVETKHFLRENQVYFWNHYIPSLESKLYCTQDNSQSHVTTVSPVLLVMIFTMYTLCI